MAPSTRDASDLDAVIREFVSLFRDATAFRRFVRAIGVLERGVAIGGE